MVYEQIIKNNHMLKKYQNIHFYPTYRMYVKSLNITTCMPVTLCCLFLPSHIFSHDLKTEHVSSPQICDGFTFHSQSGIKFTTNLSQGSRLSHCIFRWYQFAHVPTQALFHYKKEMKEKQVPKQQFYLGQSVALKEVCLIHVY